MGNSLTIFVPMLMMAGVNPAATQSAYRIGDKQPTIFHLCLLMAIILGYAQEYDDRAKFELLFHICCLIPYGLV